ncbi:hypothetical protein ABFS83_06G068700 [Erythranthe nasuta]
MCSGSKSKLCPFDLEMETGFQDDKNGILHTNLLDLAATDNLSGFIHEVEEKGCDLNKASFWYGKSFGSKKMAMEERTPIMISSLYGSTNVLNYIISTGLVDPNRACGSDGATALHCAAAGGSPSSADVAKILIDASGDIHALDSNGKKPSDVIAPCVKSSFNSKRRSLEMLLSGINGIESDFPEVEDEEGRVEKKEYPVDVSMPDINEGVYGSAEFRMYSFKVKPCSRAYSHDWTECPFVHPGENARRRDPKKYHYSCVPCPDFKKGACIKGDSCEYAHGVFESWLHPAQYRTRLCKDETGCSRKVCFFAHKHEELRPLYASTGSAMPSPKPVPVELSPSPPMSPSVVNCSSPMWMQNKMASLSTPPPSLQLPGSRLKSALSARDVEFNMELLGLERIRTQQQQRQLVEEMAGLSSSPYRDFIKPTNLDDVFGSLDPSLLFSPKINNNNPSNTNSPTGFQIRQNANQLRASYPSNGASYGGFDSSAAVAAAVMNSRSTAFSKRSQSFVDRSGGGYNNRVGFAGSPKSPGPLMNSNSLSDWSSPDGRLDWGFSGDDANKLRKSASFGLRSGAPVATGMGRPELDGSDGSWVQSMVRDGSGRGGPGHDMMPHWVDQMYMEQEQMVA